MNHLSDFDGTDLGALLAAGELACDCGKTHAVPLSALYICSGAVQELPAAVKRLGIRTPVVVADQNTWRAAGETCAQLLRTAGCSPDVCLLESTHPEADEHWYGVLAMRHAPSWDGIVAVGGGTVNDLCKLLAHMLKLPLVYVGTAPSMDGFASTTASMLQGGLKRSLPAKCPDVVIADTAVMAAAPARLLQAGLGDMLAKYTSICEWCISHIVTGEYFCPHVARLVRASLARCCAAADALMRRDEAAVAEVVSGLVLSGMAMSYAGLSRPASGVEHYFSHVWDIMAARGVLSADLHGIQTGVGVMLALPVFEHLKQMHPSAAAAEAYWSTFDAAAWEAQTAGILCLSGSDLARQRAWTVAGALPRARAAAAHWDEILAVIAEELPSPEAIRAIYAQTGLPASPADIGVSRAQAKGAFLATKDIRGKYVLTTLLSDLGWLEDMAERFF